MRFARAIFLLVAIGLFRGDCAFSQPQAKEELTTLLQRFMDAAGRGDRAVFGQFFAEDVIYTRATGAVITKQEIMANLPNTPARGGPDEKTTYSASDITIHLYRDAAVVAFQLEGRTKRPDGSLVTNHYRNTGTFLRRDGRWQVVAWQATKIDGGGPVK
ncbi:MAG TPA: nuclear transport factor 2 family protein [Candidatus Acidoferrum sp.]|nr:nuclear transport factor 2 family protein [Candidatus Acidoferrum sp.]